MANIALVKTYKRLAEIFPDRYKACEDIIKDFGTEASVRDTAWIVLPSSILGTLPEIFHNYCPGYSKAMSVFKKHGMAGVTELLRDNHNHFYDTYARLMRTNAVTNYETIMGKPADHGALRRIQDWTKYAAGKALFIKGLGTFNIPETIEAVAQLIQGRYGRRTEHPRPEQITAYGYFKTIDHHITKIITPGHQHPILQHIVRYRSQWTEELLGHLDQVNHMYEIMGQIPNLERLKPQQVIDVAETWWAMRQSTANKDNSAPFKIEGILSLLVNGYLLHQVETPQELKGISMHLNNCLNNYISVVRTGSRQIWCLYKDRELLGAGELKLIGKGKHTWAQLRGKNNRRLTLEETTAYNTALPLIIASL